VSQFRTEKDSMGTMEVPADAYYGAQTRRAELNFQISPLRAPRELIRAMGLVKKAAAHVNHELGLLDDVRSDAIQRAATEVAEGALDGQFVVDVFQTGSGTSTNMNTNEVVAGRANELLGKGRGGKSPVHPNDHVNMGQSSNDVFPTAIHVAAHARLQAALVPALRHLHTKLEERAQALDAVIKIGRTHLQDAVPIRLGQEFSGFAAQVASGIRRAQDACDALATLPIGGTAVGTGINTHAEFPARMAARLSLDTGLPLRHADGGASFEGMANRDACVEASSLVKTVAISLSNVANNIRWLASGPRCGIGEIRIPELQPGSSIMPGKVNPVIPEAVMMAAAQIVGNDATVAWANALGSNFQLNVMMPVIAYNLLQSIDLLAAAARHLADRCVDAAPDVVVSGGVRRIEADEERCRELIEQSLAMCTALAPRIGYDAAAAIAKKAYARGKTVRELALEIAAGDVAAAQAALGLDDQAAGPLRDLGVPSAAEVATILDPHDQTVRGTGVGRAAGG
jgi:fumarate hydratase class II